MLASTKKLMDSFTEPLKEIEVIRKGVLPDTFEDFLKPRSFIMKDVLNRLAIPTSTYKAKKRTKTLLDSSATEKLMRLVSVIQLAGDIIGEPEAKNWLYRKVDSLGNRAPIDLLDTEVGHRLVEKTLQQIKYGVYN